jgi:hypothetical protein
MAKRVPWNYQCDDELSKGLWDQHETGGKMQLEEGKEELRTVELGRRGTFFFVVFERDFFFLVWFFFFLEKSLCACDRIL